MERWRPDQSRELVVFPVGVHSRDVGLHLGLLALSIRLLAETRGSASDLVGADGSTEARREAPSIWNWVRNSLSFTVAWFLFILLKEFVMYL